MEEAEFLCDQITIIDNGSPIASGTSAQLKEMTENSWFYEIEVSNAEQYLKIFQGLPFIAGSSLVDGEIRVTLKKGESLGTLVEQIKPQDLKKIGSRQPSLEDVFLKLTGRGLRQ